MKKMIAIIAGILMLTAALTACGSNKDKNDTPDSATKDTVAATSAETVKVLETTAEGGAMYKDSEGNTVTTDKSGDVISVRDKNGEPVEITEYVTTHHTVFINDAAQDVDSSSDKGGDSSADKDSGSAIGSSSKSEQNGKANQSSSSSDQKKDEGQSSSDDVLIPDGQEEYELPII